MRGWRGQARRLSGEARARLNILQLGELSPLPMLLLEEALLRRSRENYLLLVRGRAPPTVVLGVSGTRPKLWTREVAGGDLVLGIGKPQKMCNVDRVKATNAPLLRRFSGGGTVVVDESCFFASWILNTDFASCKPFPKDIMRYTGGIYKEVLQRLCGSIDNGDGVLVENDYVIGDRKFGGNAQSIISERWLHHTSFLFEIKPDNMKLLSIPEKRPEYRADRPHLEFLIGLEEIGIDMEAFEESLVRTAEGLSDVTIVGDSAKDRVQQLISNDGGLEEVMRLTKPRSKFVDLGNSPLPHEADYKVALEEIASSLARR